MGRGGQGPGYGTRAGWWCLFFAGKIKLVPGTKFRVGVFDFHFIVIFHLVPGTYFKNLETNFICIFQIT